MTQPLTAFVQNLIAVHDSIDALIRSQGGGVQIMAYSQSKFELLKSADAVASEWISGSLSSPNSTALMESGLRTSIGPLSSQYQDVQSAYEQYKPQLPDITQAEIVRAILLQEGAVSVIHEAKDIAEKLSALQSSAAVTALLQQEAPETLADLRFKFAVKQAAPTTPTGLSKGP